MSLTSIQSLVIDVLKEVQTISGRTWKDLLPTSKPLFDLDGFDSLCSVEATIMVEEKLNQGELKAVSIFYSEDNGEALTLVEVSEFVQKLVNSQPGGQR